MITYHFLLARRHGVQEGYPILASFSDPLPLTRRYEELTGPECADFAKDHAELMFVSDGIVMASHDFPDPSDVEKARLAKVLATARLADSENRRALEELGAAERRAAAAKSAIKTLTPEQKELLRKEREAEEARLRAEAEAREKAEAAEREATAAARRKAEDERQAQEAKVARDTFRAEIAHMLDADLRELAKSNGAEPEIGATREEIIELIVVQAGFPPAEPTLL